MASSEARTHPIFLIGEILIVLIALVIGGIALRAHVAQDPKPTPESAPALLQDVPFNDGDIVEMDEVVPKNGKEKTPGLKALFKRHRLSETDPSLASYDLVQGT